MSKLLGFIRVNHGVCVNTIRKCSSKTNIATGLKEFEEIKIPVPWGHIAGKWWGRTDIQPIIALHGWEDNAGTFDTLVPLLNVDGVFAFDFPGHGLSSHYPKGKMYQFIDAVFDLRYLARYFNWKNLTLMGHSYGSIVSYVYSAIYPDDVDTYISLDCSRALQAQSPSDDLVYYTITDKLLSIDANIGVRSPPTYTYDDLVDLLYNGSLESPSIESCKILLKRGMIKTSESEKSFSFSRDPRLRYHAWGRLSFPYIMGFASHIKCDVLNIRAFDGFNFGEESKHIYLESLDTMKKSARRFELHDIPGTHHAHLNNPEKVAPLINNFINLK